MRIICEFGWNLAVQNGGARLCGGGEVGEKAPGEWGPLVGKKMMTCGLEYSTWDESGWRGACLSVERRSDSPSHICYTWLNIIFFARNLGFNTFTIKYYFYKWLNIFPITWRVAPVLPHIIFRPLVEKISSHLRFAVDDRTCKTAELFCDGKRLIQQITAVRWCFSQERDREMVIWCMCCY